MKTVWYVAKKDLLQVVKDKNSFIFSLAVPFILILVMGAAFGGLFSSGSSATTVTVAISNQDKDVVGNTLVKALQINTKSLVVNMTQYNDPAQVKQRVADNNVTVVGVVIPAGTTARLEQAARQGTPTQNLVQVYTLPSRNDPSGPIVQGIVGSVVGQMSTSFFAGSAAVRQVASVCQQPGNHCAPGSIDSAAIASSVGRASVSNDPTAQVAALNAGNAPTQLNMFDIVLPGYAIMFALFGIQSVAATILEEKEDGTLRRLMIAPIQKYALLGGKMLAQFIMTLGQVLILFIVGYFFFHLHVPSWPAILALLILTSFATTGLGILLVSIVKTRRQLPPIVTLVALISSAIGGAWWPLSYEPQWMQQIAKIGVTAWAMEGLNGVMLAGHTLTQIAPQLLGLFVYGLVCLLLGIRFFRFQPKSAAA